MVWPLNEIDAYTANNKDLQPENYIMQVKRKILKKMIDDVIETLVKYNMNITEASHMA